MIIAKKEQKDNEKRLQKKKKTKNKYNEKHKLNAIFVLKNLIKQFHMIISFERMLHCKIKIIGKIYFIKKIKHSLKGR